MDWREIALSTYTFHKVKQKELGASKRGRPDSLVGKKGWGIRDTAKELQQNLRECAENLVIGEHFAHNPNEIYQNRNECLRKLGKLDAPKEKRLENLLAEFRTQTSILLNDKRTKSIGEKLQKAIKEYEG